MRWLLDTNACIHILNGTCSQFAHYGLLRADLASRGTPIGANDMMITAIARHHDLILDLNCCSVSAGAPYRLTESLILGSRKPAFAGQT